MKQRKSKYDLKKTKTCEEASLGNLVTVLSCMLGDYNTTCSEYIIEESIKKSRILANKADQQWNDAYDYLESYMRELVKQKGGKV